MTTLKESVRSIVRATGYDIRRHQMANRFDAMDDTLAQLAGQGFRPSTIVDVGAHTGQWTEMARKYFRGVHYHLIEPQPECQDALTTLALNHRGIRVYPVAVTAPHHPTVQLVGGGTGAFIQTDSPGDTPATTLDELLVFALPPYLLKLDIQGHELEALTGASETLKRTAVVITEVAFFPIGADQGRATPTFVDYFTFFHHAGFTLYDIAALGGRTRDQRLVQGDCVFVKNGHVLLADTRWE